MTILTEEQKKSMREFCELIESLGKFDLDLGTKDLTKMMIKLVPGLIEMGTKLDELDARVLELEKK